MILGSGGFLGPDLTNIGESSTLKQLRQSIVDPNARIEDGFGAVTAVLRDGTRIQGVAKNNSNYSVQILDAAGKLHLLNMADVGQIRFGKTSLMPDNYGKTLTSHDLENILAFLSQQAVRPDAAAGHASREEN
jgi:putative heme-binding domain-containing protein